MQYCMATGNWGVGKAAVAGQATRTGVSQVLSRLTFAAALSHLRRANTPIGKEGKIAQPRQLHNSHFGVVCPAETPEGQACGLVKNLSLMTYVSVGGSSQTILDLLEAQGMDTLEYQASPALCADMRWSKVFINGVWVGMSDNPEELARTLREQRRGGLLGGMIHEISVARDIGERELFISTDHGRLMRPLLIVGEDGLLNLKKTNIIEHEETTWTELLRKGFIGA
jgi:DNA-directed RNA polymerase II subunit RPB2